MYEEKLDRITEALKQKAIRQAAEEIDEGLSVIPLGVINDSNFDVLEAIRAKAIECRTNELLTGYIKKIVESVDSDCP